MSEKICIYFSGLKHHNEFSFQAKLCSLEAIEGYTPIKLLPALADESQIGYCLVRNMVEAAAVEKLLKEIEGAKIISRETYIRESGCSDISSASGYSNERQNTPSAANLFLRIETSHHKTTEDDILELIRNSGAPSPRNFQKTGTTFEVKFWYESDANDVRDLLDGQEVNGFRLKVDPVTSLYNVATPITNSQMGPTVKELEELSRVSSK